MGKRISFICFLTITLLISLSPFAYAAISFEDIQPAPIIKPTLVLDEPVRQTSLISQIVIGIAICLVLFLIRKHLFNLLILPIILLGEMFKMITWLLQKSKQLLQKNKRLSILWIGILLIVLMGLFPPWVVESEKKTKNYLGGSMAQEYRYTTEPGPYSWIGDPPARAKFVDLYRLGIQYFVVAVVTAGLIITLKDKKDPKQ